MKRKILIALIIIITIIAILIIGWDLYVEVESSYKGLEFIIPLVCKRDIIKLSNGEFFDEEKLEKMYLSKWQAKRVLENIKIITIGLKEK